MLSITTLLIPLAVLCVGLIVYAVFDFIRDHYRNWKYSIRCEIKADVMNGLKSDIRCEITNQLKRNDEYLRESLRERFNRVRSQ